MIILILVLFSLLAIDKTASTPLVPSNRVAIHRRGLQAADLLASFAQRHPNGQKKANVERFIELLQYLSDPSSTVYLWQVFFMVHYDRIDYMHLLAQVFLSHPNQSQMLFDPNEGIDWSSGVDLISLPSPDTSNPLKPPQNINLEASTILELLSNGFILPQWIDWQDFMRKWALSRDMSFNYWKRLLRQIKNQLHYNIAKPSQYVKPLSNWQIVLIHMEGFNNEALMSFVNFLAYSHDNILVSGDNNIDASSITGQPLSTLLVNGVDVNAESPLSQFLTRTTIRSNNEWETMIDQLLVNGANSNDPLALLHDYASDTLIRVSQMGWNNAEIASENIGQLKAAIVRQIKLANNQLLQWHVLVAAILLNGPLSSTQRFPMVLPIILQNQNLLSHPIASSNAGQTLSTVLPLFFKTVETEIRDISNGMQRSDDALIKLISENLVSLRDFMSTSKVPSVDSILEAFKGQIDNESLLALQNDLLLQDKICQQLEEQLSQDHSNKIAFQVDLANGGTIEMQQLPLTDFSVSISANSNELFQSISLLSRKCISNQEMIDQCGSKSVLDDAETRQVKIKGIHGVFTASSLFQCVTRAVDPTAQIKTIEDVQRSECTAKGGHWFGLESLGFCIVDPAGIDIDDHNNVNKRKMLEQVPDVNSSESLTVITDPDGLISSCSNTPRADLLGVWDGLLAVSNNPTTSSNHRSGAQMSLVNGNIIEITLQSSKVTTSLIADTCVPIISCSLPQDVTLSSSYKCASNENGCGNDNASGLTVTVTGNTKVDSIVSYLWLCIDAAFDAKLSSSLQLSYRNSVTPPPEILDSASYSIKGFKSKKCLTVTDESVVTQSDCLDGSKEQMFQFKDDGNGLFTIQITSQSNVIKCLQLNPADNSLQIAACV